MEVDIFFKEGVSKSRKLITDIDVIGLCPSPFGTLSTVLGDCKTLKSQSPITRALWMKGLMELLGATQGIIVLQKDNIENDHKLAANELHVALLSDKDFDTYVKSTSKNFRDVQSALILGDNWDIYFGISAKFPALKDACEYSKSGFWNEKNSHVRLRHSIAAIRTVKSELNPANPLHIALLLDLISLFAISLNEIVSSVFKQYLVPLDKDQLSEDLRVLIWGGAENYSYWSKLRNIITQLGGHAESELSLPEWNVFLQLIRNCLEEPFSTAFVPLILKEIAFEYLSDEILRTTFTYSKELATQNLHAAKFGILIVEYLCKATKIPPEFSEIIVKRLLEIQT
jgi:hypothetical protein